MTPKKTIEEEALEYESKAEMSCHECGQSNSVMAYLAGAKAMQEKCYELEIINEKLKLMSAANEAAYENTYKQLSAAQERIKELEAVKDLFKSNWDSSENEIIKLKNELSQLKSSASSMVPQEEVNKLVDASIILSDDADFFTGDVRELTAWPRFKEALASYHAWAEKNKLDEGEK